jgi:hypothetical protein
MNAYILYECPNWSAKNHAEALQHHAPDDWNVTIDWWTGHHRQWQYDDADAIINLGSNCHKELYETASRRCPDALIVSRYNTQYPRYVDKLDMLHECSDIVIVESRQCQQAIPGRYNKVRRLASGVDGRVFRVTRPPHQRKPRVLWCAGIAGQSPERGDVKRYTMAQRLREVLAEQDIDMELLTVDPNGEDCRRPAQMRDWYNTGRIFCVTSKMEGLPNTALEAAACGCLIVGTSVGVLPEFVQQGKTGWIVPPTVEAFVEAITQANHQYLHAIRDVRERVAQWEWSRLAGYYYQLIDGELCARASNQREADNG